MLSNDLLTEKLSTVSRATNSLQKGWQNPGFSSSILHVRFLQATSKEVLDLDAKKLPDRLLTESSKCAAPSQADCLFASTNKYKQMWTTAPKQRPAHRVANAKKNKPLKLVYGHQMPRLPHGRPVARS